ncbi:MAG: LysR substrate-binding domain-containing protein [Janthinobacterium lividum]
MNVRQLEVFQSVMTAGSLTAAAGLLRVSQPAVSQLIGQLERSCGFKLFTRSGTKMRPTHEAELLFTEVQRMFVGVERVANVAKGLRDQTWGALAIGAVPVLTRRVLPTVVTHFCEKRPDVNFAVQSMRSRSLIDSVAAQQLDVGLSVLPGDRPEVDTIHVCSMRGLCILPPNHRLATQRLIRAEDLEGEAFIGLGPQDSSRFRIDAIFDGAGVKRRIRIEVGQSETACAFVAAGVGVALVDPFSVYNNQPAGFVTRLFEPKLDFDMWLIRKKLARPFALADAFCDDAVKTIRTLADEITRSYEVASVDEQ